MCYACCFAVQGYTGASFLEKVMATNLTAQAAEKALNETLSQQPGTPSAGSGNSSNASFVPVSHNMDWVAGVVVGGVVGCVIITAILWYRGTISLPGVGRRDVVAATTSAETRYAVAESSATRAEATLPAPPLTLGPE